MPLTRLKNIWTNLSSFDTLLLATGNLPLPGPLLPTEQTYSTADLKAELKTIIKHKKISPVYQPIVNLKSGKVMGYEALSRGPADSPLHYPAKLFNIAIETGNLLALEQVCREAALKQLTTLEAKQHLFLNMNAEVIKDPKFQGGLTKAFLIEKGLNPAQVTFEITERTAISDFESFTKSLNHYRQQGYCIAVDDAGAGYSSLEAIAALRPDYIKLDRSIVYGIDKDPLKQAMLDAMINLAAVINSQLIAEGIETAEELSFLIKKEVHYGQGYFLSRPAFPPPAIPQEVLSMIARNNYQDTQAKSLFSKGLGINIGDIVEHIPSVNPTIAVNIAEKIFTEQQVNGVVIVDDKRPVGLLMRDKLYYQLGTNYGISLYYRRPVDRVMEKKPLIVDAGLPLEAVSQLAMKRKEDHLYDFIIVVKDGDYAGAESVMSLLNHITNLQIRNAHNSNPLTGLPGNLIIEEQLKTLVESKKPFAVMYLDLDNFKAYNDKYGFECGDQVLLLLSRIVSQSIGKLGSTDDFLGHIGGDDFIIITLPEYVDSLAAAITEIFDREVRSLYNPLDLSKGYIEVKNRRGQPEQFPIVSISIAVVTNLRHNKFANYLEIAEIATDLKKIAKEHPGSCVVHDRRSVVNRSIFT